MKVSNITQQDAAAVNVLAKLLVTGRWDLSIKEAEVLVGTKRWLADLSSQMLDTASPGTPPPVPLRPKKKK